MVKTPNFLYVGPAYPTYVAMLNMTALATIATHLIASQYPNFSTDPDCPNDTARYFFWSNDAVQLKIYVHESTSRVEVSCKWLAIPDAMMKSVNLRYLLKNYSSLSRENPIPGRARAARSDMVKIFEDSRQLYMNASVTDKKMPDLSSLLSSFMDDSYADININDIRFVVFDRGTFAFARGAVLLSNLLHSSYASNENDFSTSRLATQLVGVIGEVLLNEGEVVQEKQL